MGGDLTLRSELGKGSCFTLWLPSSEATATPAPWEEAQEMSFEGIAVVGELLQARVVEVVGAVTRRLRADPAIPMADALNDAELEDHQLSFLIDVGQSLVILEAERGASELLRDGSDLQRLLAVRHGSLRARQRWSEEALRRELEILREEVQAVAGQASTGAEARETALRLIGRLLGEAGQFSLRGLRTGTLGG
jgi:hypothetical protein